MRAQHGRFAIEIFAGCGRLTGAWRELGLKWMPPIELSESECFDITNRHTLDWVLRFIRGGKVWLVHLAPPCAGWSVAGPDELSSQRGASIATARATARILRECRLNSVDFAVENPQSSKLWTYPPSPESFGERAFRR